LPAFRKPHAPIPEAAIIKPKQAQKTALYPTIRASGEALSAYEELWVTPAEMIAKMVNPIEVPNCAIVLNTAPASPCVLGLKESAMIRFATVKMTDESDC